MFPLFCLIEILLLGCGFYFGHSSLPNRSSRSCFPVPQAARVVLASLDSPSPKTHKMSRGLITIACVGLLCLGANMAAAEDTIIRGYIRFSSRNFVLPPNSTYRVELRDVSRMDAPSELLAAYSGSADRVNDGETLEFEVVLPEAERKHRRHHALALSAVVNAGWQWTERSQEWIREGDYLSGTMHLLKLPRGKHLIEDFVIEVKQYKR